VGYYTKYEIEILPKNEEIRQYFIDNTGFVEDDVSKWYESFSDCVNISNDNKGYLIVLTGKGENCGDVWKQAFLNGKKVWEWKLNLVIPDVPDEIKTLAMSAQKVKLEAKIQQLEEKSRKLREILDKD
jgi:hypothetical protein